MPCRCDYMDPTPQEIRSELISRLRALDSWDFSKVQDYLRKSGIGDDEIEHGIALYKNFITDGISSGLSQKPNELEDKILHAHILHTKDFKQFKNKVLKQFVHSPDVDYSPSKESIDRQLLAYAEHANCSSKTLSKDAVYKSALLNEDWGFLVEYLCSDECVSFRGSRDYAQKLVFDYLTAIVKDGSVVNIINNSELRVVLESHILFTRSFEEFSEAYLGSNFAYQPA